MARNNNPSIYVALDNWQGLCTHSLGSWPNLYVGTLGLEPRSWVVSQTLVMPQHVMPSSYGFAEPHAVTNKMS